MAEGVLDVIWIELGDVNAAIEDRSVSMVYWFMTDGCFSSMVLQISSARHRSSCCAGSEGESQSRKFAH